MLGIECGDVFDFNHDKKTYQLISKMVNVDKGELVLILTPYKPTAFD